ncbi:hypothetical protein [Nocardiopsis algeriensis]|uniref:Uncharacterized protein n=1 Tax=Nocardiopsis algeriensis TaxID=1478215 RepID=A0A841IPE1_9ACTN|nr:hypothetical protein [Nocardiopsis algeriensis]MBB6119952.1 hypothetical protein [Nocardiopsis algeriensis]
MDLAFLRPLYESGAPVASVHIDTSRDTTDAAKKIELRWRHLRDELSDLGTDKATLDVLEEAVKDGTSRAHGPHGHSLFASQGRLLGLHTLSEPPRQDRARWLPVPDPLPLAIDRGRYLPYVLVALDRVNAKVFAYPGHPSIDPTYEQDFTGDDLRNLDPMGRGGPGVLSGYNGRFDGKHFPEETWRENTARIAQIAREAVAEVDAEIIFVGGDEGAIAHLRENLGERKLSIPIQLVPGGRGGPDAQERLHQAAAEALRDFVVERHDKLLDDFQQKLANDQAVRGTEPTLPMLSEARVQTLLLGAEQDGEPELWGSPDEPVLVAKKPEELIAADKAFKAPASALMLRSAVMTDAAFSEVLDHGSTSSDSGAILRFPK